MTTGYVHGYDAIEARRLNDQARTLEALLHADTAYPAGATVLEAGCGVGAQTVALARTSPEARITAIDVSTESLAAAERRVRESGATNVALRQADLFALPFADASFDHVFVCFVLEHLADPVAALRALGRALKPGGTITVIEGDHGSTLFYPASSAADAAIAALVTLQRRAGGDALIGRRLSPLLVEAGFAAARVSPRMVYVDASRPHLVEMFTRRTFAAMIEGVREDALKAGLIPAERFDEGIRALHRAADTDGVFCYTFFKATGTRPK